MSMGEQTPSDGRLLADFGPLPGPPPMRVDGQPNVNQFFAWVGQVEVRLTAREAFASIGMILFAVDTLWGRTWLGREHFRRLRQIHQYLTTRRGLRAFARNWYMRYWESLHADPQLTMLRHDPTFLIDTAAVVAGLLEEYPAAYGAQAAAAVAEALRSVIPAIVNDLIPAVAPQASVLADALWRLVATIKGLRRTSTSRVVIVELPLGNSIPCKLLASLLTDEHIPAEILRVSTPRNTTVSRGKTRQQVLEERMAASNPGTSDLVVLVDEWLSGDSFNNVADSLRKICNARDVSFLAAGLLTEESAAARRYASHCRDHDKWLAPLGLNGVDYRFVLPHLGSALPREGAFFWSEYDRIAGYRKLQVLGSLIRQIDSTLEVLNANAEELELARIAFFAFVGQQNRAGIPAAQLTAGIVGDKATFVELFNEGCQDYEVWKRDLSGIEHQSSRGEAGDLDAAMSDVSELVLQATVDRRAGVAIRLATIYMESQHIIDTDNPFPLTLHAPVVVELDGGVQLFHERVMDGLLTLVRQRRPAPT